MHDLIILKIKVIYEDVIYDRSSDEDKSRALFEISCF